VFDGVFDRHPKLRMGFLEAGCGWLPDLVHAFHEHWEKRIRDFNPDVAIAPRTFAREMLRERTRRHRGGLVAQTRHVLGLWRRREREDGVTNGAERDRFRFEHAALDHDPVDFFRRGQVFTSFESDDPAPAYLRAGLGELGESLACFSADYGHWDGVLAGCVENVAAGNYEPAHLAKLLGGNCLRFYGPRLARAIGASERPTTD
jgi:uncharacterized protein